jgi:hypothetical protein
MKWRIREAERDLDILKGKARIVTVLWLAVVIVAFIAVALGALMGGGYFALFLLYIPVGVLLGSRLIDESPYEDVKRQRWRLEDEREDLALYVAKREKEDLEKILREAGI